MKTFVRLALGATLSLALVACASPSGQPWTPPPPATETEAPASQAPASAAPESAAPASVAPESPAGARTIDLAYTADAQIQLDGATVTDIPVTPGAEITFRITNNAGVPHSFWIGPNGSLMLGQLDGLVGHEAWSEATPVEVVWTVPADIAGLKFGSTEGSDFSTMSGTFSLASAGPTNAPGTQAPASVAPSVGPSAASSQEPGGRVIELELTAALEIKEAGAKVVQIPVTPGETIVFKITNTAGYVHNFWIGPDTALMANQTAGLTGIPDWSDPAPKELTWVVPDDITGLFYGCTVPGHYTLMKGAFIPAP